MTNITIVPQGEVVNGRVLGELEKKNRQWHYHWTCEIHPERKGLTRLKDIKNKRPQCCYLESNKGMNNPNWRGTGILSAKKFNGIKYNASTRRSGVGIKWEVTPQDLIDQWNKQGGKCSYTGWILTDINGSDASLDRIYSGAGYEVGNIEWVHKDINIAKWELSRSDFSLLIADAYHHLYKSGRSWMNEIPLQPDGPFGEINGS